MQIKVNLQIFIFIIIFILTHQIEIYSLLMLFAFLHEMGHLIIGVLLGLKPKSLHIMPFGLTVVFEAYRGKGILSYKKYYYSDKEISPKIIEIKKILIAASGPLVNALIILIVMFLNIDSDSKQIIIYSNILICIFNLMPIYPLDGGRIIKSLLRLKYDGIFTEKLTNKISNIIVIILTIISSILIVYFRNIAILFAILYLWIIIIKENRNYNIRKRMYDIIKEIN